MSKIKQYINHLPRQVFPVFLILIFILIHLACPEPQKVNTSQRETTIHLEVLSTFTTTARLHISVEDTTAEWTFGLTRNGEDILTSIVYSSDTTLTDNGLNPGTQYNYQAQWLEDGVALDTSLIAIAQTMDTTSHSFLWEIDTLGIGGSYLNDVAIIDENNIWVVGNIETDTATYNAAHWDGNEWALILIDRIVDFDGIYAFNKNDIWFSDGCFIYHYDGTSFEKQWECNWQAYGTGQANVIWGSTTDDVYFVGNNGSIVHYDGSAFTRMESGTEVDLIDIDGTSDREYVFVTGMDFFAPAYSTALQIHEGSVETLYYSEIGFPDNTNEWGAISSVSVYEDTVYFVTYRGLSKYNYETLQSTVDPAFNNYGYRNMVVQAPNDIFMVGGGGKYAHFNGASWDLNDALYNNYTLSTLWGSTDLKDDLVVITGYFRDGSHGYVALGRR